VAGSSPSDMAIRGHVFCSFLALLLLRLKPGMGYSVRTAPEKGLQYLVICVAYSNDRGTAFVDLPQFYYAPSYMKSTETRSELTRVTPLLYSARRGFGERGGTESAASCRDRYFAEALGAFLGRRIGCRLSAPHSSEKRVHRQYDEEIYGGSD
jgi:hypothetical protein